MKIEKISKVVDGIPCMSLVKAKEITNFILEKKPENILELGFFHGVSTCYMAGALDELGRGSITTIDKVRSQECDPDIEALLDKLELKKYVNFYYEPFSHLWRLMKFIEEPSTPKFDLCYFDDSHTWYDTGFAFFLVDKLLKPNGYIIFDDLDWSFDLWVQADTSGTAKEEPRVKNMPEEERKTAQVRKVFDLLVKQHPSYTDIYELDILTGWGIAKKIG
ncbi:MAG: class I SAM-dependent methyltransferase [Candidatus Gastranaerophilales bacterium]|nr:class I SAM-dependent methyltransferase [Candidatus Gastranaerophilales bacterium]